MDNQHTAPEHTDREPRSPRRLAEDVVRLLLVEERAATLGREPLRRLAAQRANEAALRLARVTRARLEETL